MQNQLINDIYHAVDHNHTGQKLTSNQTYMATSTVMTGSACWPYRGDKIIKYLD